MTTNILGYIPKRWDDVIGCAALKRAYMGLLRQVRVKETQKAFRLFVSGLSRGGKTATTTLFAQAMLCPALDLQTLNPCGVCEQCTSDASIFGHRGIEVYLAGGKVHYLPIDSTKVTSVAELIDVLTDLRSYEGTRVVFLDEVHRLQLRGMDEQLLKPVEQRAFIWIFCSAHTTGLEDMLKNRFVKISAQPPELPELVTWLANRCEEWEIRYDEWALIDLAKRRNLLPGIALQAVDLASLDPEEGLTRKLVEEFEFKFNE